LLQDIYDPSSPNFRHYLTTAQFTDQFGPTDDDYQAVVSFAKAHNLSVTSHPNRLLVGVDGAVADLEQALHVIFRVYHHPTEARDFFAPDAEPTLDLSVPVMHIGGMDNYKLPHPNMVRGQSGPPGVKAQFGSGPGGTYLGYDYRAAYLPGTTLDGSGQIVGLLQFDGYFPNDIALYEAQAGLPKVPLVNVLLDGFNGTPGFNNSEVALDIEMVASMAPHVAQIIVYEGFLKETILNRMATDNLAQQLSASWTWSGGPDPFIDQIFQEMAAQGQTFFHSSGDSDAFPPGAVSDPTLVNAPSDSPYITQVGGTTLFTSGPLGAWTNEIVWNYFNDVGSSGGISSFYSIPSWQQGISMTASGGSTVFRNTPDVALTADNVYIVADDGFGQPTSGTSCASPLWAGVAALINQQAANSGSPPIGFINPAVYAIGKGVDYTTAFHDIVTGNNTNSISTNAFFAAPGYDLCTGWGSPASTNLINLLVVPSAVPLPRFVVVTNIISGGNDNGIIDNNECNNFDLVLANTGRDNATDVHVTLSTTTPGVIIAQPTSAFPNISTNSSATNIVSFRISTAPEFICGVPIELSVQIKCDQVSKTLPLTLSSGVPGAPLRFDNFTPAFIPDVGSTNSVIVVSNVNFALSRIAVALYITHTFDSDLVLQLISPEGITNTLANNNGGGGHNYGLACSPDSSRTTFDDLATNTIVAGIPPFAGLYQPLQPLSIFAGKAGTNVNGPWRLVVFDTAPFDVGTLQCWSLIVTPTTCTNGGGECPGSDMAVGLKSLPEPALVGNNLIYTISVTNNGPSAAHNVSVSQVLPSGVVYVTGSASQGAVVQNGGIVTANLGAMSAGATATVNVTVLPAVPGVYSSTATVTSDQPDFIPLNNNATMISHVNPPTADLAIGLVPFPTSLLIGGNVTYTLAVTNNGPSAASSIMVTNIYPATLALRTLTISQGNLFVTNGNTVVCSFGGLSSGGRATATITATPVATGTMLASATVTSANPNEIDPIIGNNSVTVPISVGPAAELAVGLVAIPSPVVVGSNLTFVTSVTNFGPSTATSVALNGALPAGLPLVSTNFSQGSLSFNSGTNFLWQLGSLNAGARATLTLVVNASRQSSNLLASVSISATEADPNLNNNSAAVTVIAASPFFSIVAAGASQTTPASGFMDIGQTNTVLFRLQNIGNVVNTSLIATLQTNASVTPLSGSQTYGILKPVGAPGGGPVARAFTFVSQGTNGGTVTAVLSLRDGANSNVPPVSFSFLLPVTASFANTNLITIPDPNNMPTLDSGPAAPYPATVQVSGVTGQVARVTATLVNLTHSYPHDINALLVGPTGASTLLLSHAADQSAVTNATVTFDDTAPNGPLPNIGSIASGSWQPSAYPPPFVFPAPAPTNSYSPTLSVFGGIPPNGTWSLFVYDDNTGDAGFIGNGWSLNILTASPVNQTADLGLTALASPASVFAGDPLTYGFTVSNAGPSTATGVTFSNLLPASVTLLSVTVSQGNYVTNGNLVTGNLASLAAGSNATVTVVVKPGTAAVGQLTNTATVNAFETDLHTSDNRVALLTSVTLPVADLAVGLSVGGTNAVVGSNLVYSITLTNAGPNKALNTTLNAPLPPTVKFVSAYPSSGTVFTNAGAVVGSFGDLLPAQAVTVTLTVIPQAVGLLTNTASAGTVSSDPVGANNSASLVVIAANPAPIIVAAGAALVFESFLPPNGVIDPGEQVTVALTLANAGQLDTLNLVATLQEGSGVTLPGPAATYGHLVAGSAPVTQEFSFTASPAAAGSITANLQLTDGLNNLGVVGFTFNLPTTTAYANPNAITIPDHGPGSPYPSIISVSGLTSFVTKATVTVSNLTHTFPQDVNVLLVNPAGASTLLMSHNGGAYAVTNLSLTFDDAAPAGLGGNTRLLPGSYRPSRSGSVHFPGPAPAAPYGATLSTLNNVSPNGVWSLFVFDDSPGDSGVISSGWSLKLATLNPVAPVADLGVGMTVSPASVLVGGTLAYTVNVTNFGPAAVSTVTVQDPLPQGFAYISSVASTGSVFVSESVLMWSIPSVVANGTATMSFTVAPGLAGNSLNVATVSGNCTDLNSANNSAQALASISSPIPATLSGVITGGQFHLTVHAQAGLNYQVQATSNFTSWTSLGTYTAVGGVFTVTDTNSPAFSTRYYRTVRQYP
jgi:uncharacterized repeat protein (TIGR01451 family)